MTRRLFARGPWKRVAETLDRQHGAVLVAVDFDGTLVPITSRPLAVRVQAGALRALGRAARLPGVRVAILSARPLRDLRRYARARGVALVAQYGLEGPLAPPAGARRRWRAAAARLERQLRDVAAPFAGAWVEAKGLTVAVHDRGLSPARRAALHRALPKAIREARRLGFEVALGRRVTDFVPKGYGKGRALAALKHRFGPRAVVYFGDSPSDEPAFAVLRGNDISVRVGRGPTRARYRVAGPADVTRFLRALNALRRRREADPGPRRSAHNRGGAP